jgi:hypothetical protein
LPWVDRPCIAPAGPYRGQLRRSRAPADQRANDLKRFLVGLLFLPPTLPQPTVLQMFDRVRMEFLSLPAKAKDNPNLGEFERGLSDFPVAGMPYELEH